MGNSIEIVLADPNPLILSALSDRFSKDPKFSLVTTVTSTETFMTSVLRVPVDVAVVCWNLPSMGGERIIEILRDMPQAPKIVIYSQSSSPDLPRRALTAGAAGFCGKDQSVQELMQTCEDVASGKMVFPFMDVRDLQADPLFTLTKRERAMLQALSEGMTNAQLATHFGVSINTVKFHLSNLYEKLGVKSRAKAITFFYSRHLDQSDDLRQGRELREIGDDVE